jgi:hypothetical protein
VEDSPVEDLAGLEAARLRVERGGEETDFSDNVGLTVVMPGEDMGREAEEPRHPTCSTFLIFGVLMGCLLIVSSVMMCLLAHRSLPSAASLRPSCRLHTTMVMYKQEKAGSVLRDHTRRYGIEPGGRHPPAAGGRRAGHLSTGRCPPPPAPALQ